MSSLISRGAVLTFSRLSNFGVLLISPLLLVRILEVEAYGQYQEFMIYATLLITVCGFTVDSSLTYFLPKYEELERVLVSQTSVLILAFSTLCLTFLVLARPFLLQVTSYDFVAPLAAYVFFFVNLNWLEYYWIAKGRTDLVLYYSAVRVVFRVTVLLFVAYITRDLPTILWSLVGVEAVRITIVAAWMFATRMFTSQWRSSAVTEQLRYSGPLGVSVIVQQLGRNVGKLFIGSVLGPAALAYYAVGSYLIPIVRVIRHSIADVIFPELVRSRHDPAVALRLWQRTQVMFCVLLFPAFVVLVFYAELIVRTLFTEAYLAAVPVFQVYLLWIIRRCFNLDVLLRSRGKTGYVLIGTFLALAINLPFMFMLYRQFGLIGPALAFIIAEISLEVFYARCVTKEWGLRATELVDWRGVGRVAFACVCSTPLLMASEYLSAPDVVSAGIASTLFWATCWYLAYRMGVSDIGRLMRFAAAQLRRLPRVG